MFLEEGSRRASKERRRDPSQTCRQHGEVVGNWGNDGRGWAKSSETARVLGRKRKCKSVEGRKNRAGGISLHRRAKSRRGRRDNMIVLKCQTACEPLKAGFLSKIMQGKKKRIRPLLTPKIQNQTKHRGGWIERILASLRKEVGGAAKNLACFLSQATGCRCVRDFGREEGEEYGKFCKKKVS